MGSSSTCLTEKDLQAGRGDQSPGEVTPAFFAPFARTDLGRPHWLLTGGLPGGMETSTGSVIAAKRQSTVWSLLWGAAAGCLWQGELGSPRSSLARSALAAPGEQSPSESLGSWRVPWGTPLTFSNHWPR